MRKGPLDARAVFVQSVREIESGLRACRFGVLRNRKIRLLVVKLGGVNSTIDYLQAVQNAGMYSPMWELVERYCRRKIKEWN